METRTKAIQDARDEGHQAAKEGAMLNENPYPENTELHDAWRRAWNNAEKAGSTPEQSPGSGTAGSYSALSDEDLTILHAAMTAMTQGIHACQSNLSEEEWERAQEIWNELDDEINSRAL